MFFSDEVQQPSWFYIFEEIERPTWSKKMFREPPPNKKKIEKQKNKKKVQKRKTTQHLKKY
jgi:hypothetical protein